MAFFSEFKPTPGITYHPRKLDIAYYGKECYRNCLSLSIVDCIWDPLTCPRLRYTDPEMFTIDLVMYNTEEIDTTSDFPGLVIFILDSEESFKGLFNLCNSNNLRPILLVCVTNKEFELTPSTKRFMKCLGQLLGDVIYLEFENCGTKQGENMKFLETIDVKTIKHIHQKMSVSDNWFLKPINKVKEIKLKKLLTDKLPKDFTLANFEKMGIDAYFYYDNFMLRFALKSGVNSPHFGYIWWRINLRYSTFPSNSDLFKAESAEYAEYLYEEISHEEGDIHSLHFVRQDCDSIIEIIRLLKSKNAPIRRLLIRGCTGTLSFKFLSTLPKGLEYLVVVDTRVNLDSLIFPIQIVSSLRNLVLNECHDKTEEVPSIIGRLENLEVLDVRNNNFKHLPVSFSNLDRLEHLQIDTERMVSPPRTILSKSAKDVVQYFKEIQAGKSTANREAKVMVVGQEGVGKSTLVTSLKRWIRFWNTTPPTKTDGIEISILQIKDTDCKVYDLAGDVEYLNTHPLFFSPNCLHLAVFDLSNVTVSKESQSTDQFCRLELWLQTVASQDPLSYAIIVGTHADHNLLSPEVLAKIRKSLFDILLKYRSQHQSCCTFSRYDECMICNPEKISTEFSSSLAELPVPSEVSKAASATTSSGVPHILGYFEVSGITNKNIEKLKLKVRSSTANIKRYTKTDNIPETWLRFRQSVLTLLSNVDDQLRQQPLLPLTTIEEMANEMGIWRNESMLRFFHSQGDFLWYEEIPEMKEVVIVDPQWLSDQLRTLVSHLPSVNAVCEGVLHHSHLPELWCNMSEENRTRLLSLFRSVGLCFSISHDEDLFPCKLPVGWPDRKMWPPFPAPNENQTCLLFEFSFVPSQFFPDLIVAINKKQHSFPKNVRPLYYRFNAVYITKQHGQCHLHGGIHKGSSQACAAGSEADELLPLFHRVHMELTPHSNSLKVTIRGPHPCCQITDIRSTIKAVKSQRYPGISCKELLICPKCEIERLHKPSSFAYQDNHDGFCSKGHDVGSTDDILAGKLDTSVLVTSTVGQAGRVMGETLDDHFCPKLFVVLPINLDSLSFKDRFVYSYLRDGYAVHLLCECPEQWHFVSSPGFRVGKPKEFFKTYGGRVCKLLRVISALGTPLKIASSVEPHCKAGATVANAADTISKELKALLDDYLEKYPHLKASIGSPNDDLKDLKSPRGLQRSELSRFLEVAAKGRDFGTLICTYVDKFNEWLWLCEEHNQKYEIVERQ